MLDRCRDRRDRERQNGFLCLLFDAGDSLGYVERFCVYIRAALEGREIPPMPPLAERCDTAVRQFQLSAANKGEKIACLEARRHYAWYLKGVPHAGYYKEQIVKITTLEDVYRVTKGIKRDLC